MSYKLKDGMFFVSIFLMLEIYLRSYKDNLYIYAKLKKNTIFGAF
jgi:hypothetical protein